MSIDKAIKEAVKDALEESSSKYPILCKKITLASLLDVSVDQIDKFMREGVLIEDKHYTRLTKNGNPMYYLAEIVTDLKPSRATAKVNFIGG